MQSIFIAVAILGASYFLFAKREFDILSVGYASALVYFSPGFTGEVLFPMEHSQFIGYRVAIHAETYLVMTVVLIAIAVATILFDMSNNRSVPTFHLSGTSSFPKIAIGYTYLGMVMTWVVLGVDVMTSPDKNHILEEFTRWSILWTSGSVIAFTLAFEQRRVPLILISAIPLMVEIYAGFRSSIAIAIIAVACLWLNRQGETRLLVKQWRVLLIGAAATLFLFVYKLLFSAVKAGDWELISELIMNPALYSNAFLNSEPFLTQSILNEVVREDFQVGLTHFAATPLSFLLFAPELGWILPTFNDLVQAQLFPNLADSGIAANIWAEMLSAGGWPLLLLFISIFALCLCWGSYLIRVRDPVLRSGIVAMFCFLAFYAHRNELQFQVTLEKRTLLFFALCWLTCRISPKLGAKLPILRRAI